ncbi:GerAB/ArcD/ProY family transporter [Halalkalibacter krulwichiae]|uniref:Spore germination protein B2 n=1 Tax=Halalkalibacter krulwichiae TaxID=199441 RepID=A0A1X9MDJ3_9BACI|nr:GerAB/ArcD/ProY family transporter [Halalkalibacter krulwichiae]ARK30704.1 Spore germination protein B2 [Halalkalibacter krulwichiae]
MDKGNFKKLNKYHVIFLAQNTMIGIGLFSLPSDISDAGYNLWLVPIFLGILANATLIPIIMLCKKFPNDHLFKISEKVLGKVVGKGLNVIFFVYALLACCSVSRSYVRVLQTITLPEYTIAVPSILLYFVMYCIAHGGVKSLARFCIFSFFVTGWLVYFIRWPFQMGNWYNAIPTFEISMYGWLQALFHGSMSMFGYGLILFYYPYIQDQKKAFVHTSIGIWIAVSYYVAVSLGSVVYFSPWQLDQLLFPVLNLLQAVQLEFVERIETFGTTLWVFLILSTTAVYLWVAKKGLDALFSHHQNRTWHLIIVAFISWFLFAGPIPYDIQDIIFDDWGVFYGYGLILVPILLLIANKIKHRKQKQQTEEAASS